jgi:hypothetical protein
LPLLDRAVSAVGCGDHLSRGTGRNEGIDNVWMDTHAISSDVGHRPY